MFCFMRSLKNQVSFSQLRSNAILCILNVLTDRQGSPINNTPNNVSLCTHQEKTLGNAIPSLFANKPTWNTAE